ncbi:2'-5' RNA ligase family protein [Sinomonas sp. P47F7]|uniref:2'-5' RNA ligase family protein n=1 Tax=Sinomonas sp. P47F7 TaxID=3410987 RepID=UPI003BF491FF
MDASEAPAAPESSGPQGAFVVVAFVEWTPVGEPFSKHRWPLHVTLLRFDAPYEAALAAVGRAFEAHDGGIGVRIGGDAHFGYRGRVRVSLVEPEPALDALHARVLAEVTAAGGRVHSPQHTGQGFKPHVSVQGERRVHRGDRVRLDDFALVDMAPDGDTSVRVVVADWGAGATPPGPA